MGSFQITFVHTFINSGSSDEGRESTDGYRPFLVSGHGENPSFNVLMVKNDLFGDTLAAHNKTNFVTEHGLCVCWKC